MKTYAKASNKKQGLESQGWETIFDSKRDNAGKALPIKKLIHALKKTLEERIRRNINNAASPILV